MTAEEGMYDMEYIRVTDDNIEKEHICCAISNNKDVQVSSKKTWLKERFEDGLVFLKSVERGKCFIEYIPAENAWIPIDADNYMYIDCFWVSGSFKGHGYANDLMDECIRDAKEKGKAGLCVLSSEKKKPFLSDPGYLKYKGFEVTDRSDTGIWLMTLRWDESAELPQFKPEARHPKINEEGYVLYYSDQCPFNAKYVPIIESAAADNGIKFRAIHIDTKEQAQSLPCPCTTYAFFHDGEFITNEEFSEKKFLKMALGESGRTKNEA